MEEPSQAKGGWQWERGDPLIALVPDKEIGFDDVEEAVYNLGGTPEQVDPIVARKEQ
jgi:hypothetical protein